MPIHDALLRGVDSRAFAFTLLPRDEDGVVRQVVLALPTQQGQWPTSAGWLCEVLDGRCETGLIDYALGPAYRYMPARRLLEIRDDKALARLFGGRIVFVAPVAGPDDRVAQPVSLAGWEAADARALGGARARADGAHAPARRADPARHPCPLMLLAIAAAALSWSWLPRRWRRPSAPWRPSRPSPAASSPSGWAGTPPRPRVLATLLAAVIASRLLGRRPNPAPAQPLRRDLSDIRHRGVWLSPHRAARIRGVK